MDELNAYLVPKLSPLFEKIHLETGLEESVVGGSFASAEIADAVGTVYLDDESVDPIELVANDIDTYHGRFT